MRSALAALLVPLSMLTACGGTSEEKVKRNHPPIVEESVTLEDGRSVTCLLYDRALDCDW